MDFFVKFLEVCEGFFLAVSVGAIPKNTKKAKRARNAKKSRKRLRKGSGRRVPGGSAQSEARPFNQVIKV